MRRFIVRGSIALPSLAFALVVGCSDDVENGAGNGTGNGEADTGGNGAQPDAAPPADASAEDSGPLDAAADAGSTDVGPVAPCPAIGTALPEGTAPPRRGDTSLAVDEACGRLYLFSGDDGEPQNCGFPPSSFVYDLYVYDTFRERWYEVAPQGDWMAAPPTAPIPRARMTTAWDANRGRLVVFGGRWRAGSSGAYTFPSDVWAYDPETNDWSQLASEGAGPAGRMGHTMHADPDRDRMIIAFGAREFAGLRYDVTQTNDVWAFDLENNAWDRLADANPPGSPAPQARLFHYAAVDTLRGRLWLFSGSSSDPFGFEPTVPSELADSWYLDLPTERWTRYTPGTPPTSRFRGPMAYDATRDQLVIYGGHDNTPLGNNSEVWTYDIAGNAWTLRNQGDTLNPDPSFDPNAGDTRCNFPGDFANYVEGTPERREGHMFAILGDAAYMYGGRTDCGVANDTWELDLESFAWTELNISFSGMTCPRNGRDDCGDPSVRMCD